ncbi:hypothetical protein ACFL6G_04085 [candidate division KSB1 bacterium]
MTTTVNELVGNYIHLYKKYEKISPTAMKSILELLLESNGDDFGD